MYKIFGKPACVYCTKAKNLLDRKGIEYEYVDISTDADAYDFIVNENGFRTVPQIWGNETYIGGYEALVESPLTRT